MNDKKFNNLLWEFHRELKQLRNFKEDTVKTYISCIQKYRIFAKEKPNIDFLETTEEHLFEFILDLKKKLSPGRITHFRADPALLSIRKVHTNRINIAYLYCSLTYLFLTRELISREWYV